MIMTQRKAGCQATHFQGTVRLQQVVSLTSLYLATVLTMLAMYSDAMSSPYLRWNPPKVSSGIDSLLAFLWLASTCLRMLSNMPISHLRERTVA